MLKALCRGETKAIRAFGIPAATPGYQCYVHALTLMARLDAPGINPRRCPVLYTLSKDMVKSLRHLCGELTRAWRLSGNNMRPDGTVRLDAIADCPTVRHQGGKVLIYACVALDEKRRFVIFYERQADGSLVDFIRCTQGHTIKLEPRELYGLNGEIEVLPSGVTCITHSALCINMVSIERYGIKLGAKQGNKEGRVMLHTQPGTPHDECFKANNTSRHRDIAYTLDVNQLKSLDSTFAQTSMTTSSSAPEYQVATLCH